MHRFRMCVCLFFSSSTQIFINSISLNGEGVGNRYLVYNNRKKITHDKTSAGFASTSLWAVFGNRILTVSAKDYLVPVNDMVPFSWEL